MKNIADVYQQDQHLLHPLHHPAEHERPLVFVRGSGFRRR